jgi:AcrR family transcriptional regulator
MDVRERLLKAALGVYAEAGTRGATTRRIAHAASVNEVTLFRHFGSKESLIREALGWGCEHALLTRLPEQPVDPKAELTAFCEQQFEALSRARSIIRKVMGEFEEHPDECSLAFQTPIRVARELTAYLERLREAGLATGDWNARAACAMLMGTLFSDAMGRECMPERYPYSPPEGLAHYVSLFLRAIGVDHPSDPLAASRAER